MKKFLFFVASIFLLVPYVNAQNLPGDYLNIPRPQAYVNDYAGIISSSEKTSLEQILVDFEKNSGNEVIVVTVPSLQEMTIEDFTVRLFEKWGIGKKGKDNGLLFLVAPTERKVRFEVGYGLEPYITDSTAGRIIRSFAEPNFKEGNFDLGINQSVLAAIAVISDKGGTESLPLPEEPSSYLSFLGIIFNPFVFFIIVSFFSYLASYFGRSKRIWPGGAAGAIFGLAVGVIFFTWLWALVGTVLLGLLGFLFDHIVSKNYAYRKAHGLPTDFRHSGGGFWFGGGRGGGFGGGGFGGFGGGRSGGGGASGGW